MDHKFIQITESATRNAMHRSTLINIAEITYIMETATVTVIHLKSGARLEALETFKMIQNKMARHII